MAAPKACVDIFASGLRGGGRSSVRRIRAERHPGRGRSGSSKARRTRGERCATDQLPGPLSGTSPGVPIVRSSASPACAQPDENLPWVLRNAESLQPSRHLSRGRQLTHRQGKAAAVPWINATRIARSTPGVMASHGRPSAPEPFAAVTSSSFSERPCQIDQEPHLCTAPGGHADWKRAFPPSARTESGRTSILRKVSSSRERRKTTGLVAHRHLRSPHLRCMIPSQS